jgi:hypothetical protein
MGLSGEVYSIGLSRLQGGELHIIILYSSTYYKKGHVIQRNLKIPNVRVSRFVD